LWLFPEGRQNSVGGGQAVFFLRNLGSYSSANSVVGGVREKNETAAANCGYIKSLTHNQSTTEPDSEKEQERKK